MNSDYIIVHRELTLSLRSVFCVNRLTNKKVTLVIIIIVMILGAYCIVEIILMCTSVYKPHSLVY